MRSTRKNKELFLLAGMFALSLLLYAETYAFDVAAGAAASAYGPAFFPRILLGLIACLVLAIGGQVIRQKSQEKAEVSAEKGAFTRVVGILAACLLAAFVWEYAGFLFAAGVFAVAACVLLKPSLGSMVSIAVFIPAAWYFFSRVLMVSL